MRCRRILFLFWRAWLPVVVVGLGWSRLTTAAGVERVELDRRFQAELNELAAKCDELKLPEQAKATRAWSLVRDPGRQLIFLPPSSAGKPAGSQRLVQLWHRKFRQIRDAHAERLFNLARETADDNPTAAYQLLHEVLHENPVHEAARRVLGHRKIGKSYRTDSDQVRSEIANQDHRKLGWRRRGYWIVTSPHYRIVTSKSSRAGIELARHLERLHEVWRQLFYGYWEKPTVLPARFDDARPTGKQVRPRHEVVLFRDRQQYVETLRRSEPQIEKTVGYYADTVRTSYYFAAGQPQRSIWNHEGSHQLFQEMSTSLPNPGGRNNFWMIEGAALYMESLRLSDRYATVGGFDADRLQFARYRALTEGFYRPLSQLVGIGRTDLQRDADLRKLYSQAAGLTHFLMDGNGGRYRPAVLRYLKAIYQGRVAEGTLATETAVGLDTLDKQYHEFLNVTDADLKFLNSDVTNLCLGHTQVTDRGLAGLAECRQLKLLDLSFTKAGDATIQLLDKARDLRQLHLEQTAVSDRSLEWIGRLRSLEELDLSSTGITDGGLPHLSRLGKLSVLWLSGTMVSDRGLTHLRGLKQLEQLETGSSRVTAEGVARLQAVLPRLNRP